MVKGDRRDFLKQGATAMLGVGGLGALSGGLAAGCAKPGTGPGAATAAPGAGFALNEPKYRQLTAFPDVRKEFVTALDEVTDALLGDPAAYTSFIESSDAVGSLRVWDANAAKLTELVGATDGTTKRGRLKRILTVSELYDGVAGEGPGFLDRTDDRARMLSSSSSSSGGCATNGSATNGCCVIHTWGWSAGEGKCSKSTMEPSM